MSNNEQMSVSDVKVNISRINTNDSLINNTQKCLTVTPCATCATAIDCVQSPLLEICLTLAVICTFESMILIFFCIIFVIRHQHRKFLLRKRRTRDYVDRNVCIDYVSVLLNPDEDGGFRTPLHCNKCKKVSTGCNDMCVHYQRMRRFIVMDQNNK